MKKGMDVRKMIAVVGMLLPLGLTTSAFAHTYCDQQYKELQGYAIAAKAEQLPPEQRMHFEAQLTAEQSIGLMAMRGGHGLGTAINNSMGGSYRDSLTDVFNKKLAEFKTKCGFMLK